MCVCLFVQRCVSADKHTALCENMCSLHILAIMFVHLICVRVRFLPSITVYLSADLCVCVINDDCVIACSC